MKTLFKYQGWHFLALGIMLTGIIYSIQNGFLALKGSLFGISTLTWLIVTLAIPVLHQIYVLICWRLELFSHTLSNLMGEKAFQSYKIIFVFLIVMRLITICLLAFSNKGTLDISDFLRYSLSGMFFVLAGYTLYSVKTYFGFQRAMGLDHFDTSIGKGPLVRKGVHRITRNAMYIFGLLFLYIPGLLLQSELAIMVAIFSHLYIWVHYYCTELPDMKFIYGNLRNL